MLQLDELESKALAANGKTFPALTLDERRTLVRQLLPAGNASIADVAGANHVALSLLAHFYGSTKATDLCYEAAIGKESCRPLDRSSAKPIPLRRSSPSHSHSQP